MLVSIFRGRYVYGFCVGVYTQIFTVGVGVSAGIAKSENEIETTLDAVETYVSVVNSLSGNSVAVSDGRNVLSGIKVLVCSEFSFVLYVAIQATSLSSRVVNAEAKAGRSNSVITVQVLSKISNF